MNNLYNIPITFIIFNRPETTRIVFEKIKKVRLRKIFVISDAARNELEREKVIKARNIINEIDWPCDVKTCYAGENMGCGKRVSSGIDWVFEQVDKTIILEDDCVPNMSFLNFAKKCFINMRMTRE